MEAYSGTNRIRRGGQFDSFAFSAPASCRVESLPNSGYVGVGFRPALYIKVN